MMNRRAMLQTLRGEIPSPWGDRVYLHRPASVEIPPDAKDFVPPSVLPQYGFVHPGRWKIYLPSDGTTKRYQSAEAILDDGWLVE